MTDEILYLPANATIEAVAEIEAYLHATDGGGPFLTPEVRRHLVALVAAVHDAVRRPEAELSTAGWAVVEVYPVSRIVRSVVDLVPTLEDAQALDADDRAILRCVIP